MAKASLLCDIFNNVYQKEGSKYCMICFRSLHERRLVDGTNVMKFKYFRQSNRLKSKDNTRYERSKMFGNCLVCYMCDRQAAAAVKFCIAANLSNKLHYMFSKMKLNQVYKRDIFNQLQYDCKGKNNATIEAVELQTVLDTIRNMNTLLQTETLLLGNDKVKEQPSPKRSKLRDLLTFETEPVTDEGIPEFTDLSAQPDTMTKTILLEDDDDPTDNIPHPIAIIHNPSNNGRTNTPTIIPSPKPPQTLQNIAPNPSGMILQPVIFNINGNSESYTLNNGTLTPLNNINAPNFVINPIGSNLTVPIMGQFVNKDQMIPINNLNVNNQFILPVPQNNTTVMVPKTQTTNQNSFRITSVTGESTMLTTNMSLLRKKVEPVKTLTAGVKRSDSECHVESDSAPTAVKTGKIDWEDQIPMDVISFVSNTDQSRNKSTLAKPYVSEVNKFKDPVDNFVISDVKSISEMPQTSDNVIDLC